jgi:hypothetical protein
VSTIWDGNAACSFSVSPVRPRPSVTQLQVTTGAFGAISFNDLSPSARSVGRSAASVIICVTNLGS